MTAPDQAYVPTWQVELAPVGADLTDHGVWTVVPFESGTFTEGHPDLAKQLTLSLPRDFDEMLDDFAAPGDNTLQRGTHIRLTLAEDNNFTGGGMRKEVKLLGRIWESTIRHMGGDTKLELIAHCRLAKARAIGMNISKTTRMLLYKVSWTESTAGVWDATDPDYLANIPVGVGDGDPAGAGAEDFVPGGVVFIRSRRPGTDLTEKESAIEEYTPDTFDYASGRKQVYFKANRGAVVTHTTDTSHFTVNSDVGFRSGDSVEIVSNGAVYPVTLVSINATTNKAVISPAVGSLLAGDLMRWGTRQWDMELYYYDPTDLANTVKAFITYVLTGEPWSYNGGMGVDPLEVDLEEIYGFNGVDPLLIRTVLRDKTEGNIQTLFESLRDNGLIASNYRIEDYAPDGTIRGRSIVQNDGAAITPAFGVFSTEEKVTFEGQAGRVELYGQAVSPQNVLIAATVTVNLTGELSGYLERGFPESMQDGRGPTQYEVYKRAGVDVNYQPVVSDNDFIVFDAGESKEFRTALFRGGHPTDLGEDLRMYLIQRMPRWTISASEDPIDASNPGIPIAHEAINFQVDPNNIGQQGGYDVRITATNIHKARYFALRLEQDCLYRATDKQTLSGKVIRESVAIVGEFAILDDGRLKYNSGPFRGEYPAAQIVKYSTTVDTVTSDTVFDLVDVSWLAVNDWIQVMRAGVPVSTQVTNIAGSTVTVSIAVTGVTLGDDVGEAGRWKFTLAGTWEDLLYPELYDKLVGTTDWLEVMEDDRAGDVSEAEGLAVERLIELIKIQRDYKAEIAYDKRVQVGTALRPYAGWKPFTANKLTYNLRPPGTDRPMVTQDIDGTDYEQEPS